MGANNNIPFKIRNSSIHGRGAFATRRIRKGQRIIEYVGEMISDKEADRRYGEDGNGNEPHHTMLFSVAKNVNIDGCRIGNVARYINHSCAPNCEAVDEEGHIFIEAVRNIQPGVELTYDYQFEMEESLAESRILYPCVCGEPKCRGTIVKRRRRKRSRKTKRTK